MRRPQKVSGGKLERAAPARRRDEFWLSTQNKWQRTTRPYDVVARLAAASANLAFVTLDCAEQKRVHKGKTLYGAKTISKRRLVVPSSPPAPA